MSKSEFGLPLLFALPFACMMSWISHGFSSKFSHWCFAGVYYALCLTLSCLEFSGLRLGLPLLALLALYLILTLLCTLLAYRKEKQKMRIHLLVTVLAFAAVYLTGVIP